MLPARWTPTKSDWLIFLALAAVLVSIRLFLITTNQWNDQGELPESLISGRAAFDILNGTWRGWAAYLYKTAGHLLNEMGATPLLVPLFWLAGPSMLTMMAVPILASVITAALMFRLSPSRDAAILATIYLVFMPLTVQSWQIYPYFNLGETMTWLLLALWILEPVHTGVSSSLGRPFVAGLLIGIGILLCDLEIAAVPAIFAAWWLSTGERPARRVWLPAALGVMAGVFPYIVYVVMRPTSQMFLPEQLSVRAAPASLAAYLNPLAYPASMLWPFANLTADVRIRLVIGAAGIIGLIWWAMREMRRGRPSLVASALVGFIAIFSVLNVLTRTTSEYYSYALAAPIAFVVGSALADLIARWDMKARRLAIAAAAALGVMVMAPAISRHELREIRAGWHVATIARGYSFYSPGFYRPFGGYKTALGEEVERAVSHIKFTEPGDPAQPHKIIFEATGRVSAHALQSAEDYYIYGVDVTAHGVGPLAAQAAREVEPRFWPQAFGSLAVFAANDLLLTDLVATFAEGTIDRVVPDCCVAMFYSEIGRKIRDRQAQADPIVTAWLSTLTPVQRAWLERGGAESRLVN